MNAVVQNTAVFKPLTNRDAASTSATFALPDDGFVQLVPKGEAPNILGDGKDARRIIQVVDDEALGLIINKLLNRTGEEMLIDDDHLSHEMDQTTDANGWQLLNKDSLQVREDGLYGNPRWTTLGLDKLTGGIKRFISPEFAPGSIAALGGKRYRVTELTGLALTNRPGFKRLQKPLTNRDADDGIDTATTHTMHKALLAAHLGITESDIEKLDETTLKNRLSEVKSKAATADTLKGELDTIKNREVEKFISDHDTVIPKSEDLRKHLKETFLTNRETAQVMVDGFKAARASDGLSDEQRARAAKKPLFNRETAEAPKEIDAKKAADHAGKIASRARELCNREKISWDSAWKRAESEIPAE